jgi:oxygen-independent coproporphyrinogen-3 oxidase
MQGESAHLPPLALYVHMPWCVRKCPYCDFNSHQLKGRRPDADYIGALIRDFEAESPLVAGRRVHSVFFGGGTPSLFGPEDYERLLAGLRRRIDFQPDAEITLEANPGTIERGRFQGYRDAGINRVSLGAQSFSQRSLELLGRIHSAEDTLRAVEELRAAQLHNFNLDLMYALPEQSIEQALDDVRTAVALAPAHLSHYQLTLEPGTVFHARPPAALPDEDAAWRMQTDSQELLGAAGYAQYEVSAYARPGAHCRHNLNYWAFGDYVGIGAGAHGKLTLAAPHRILRSAKPKQPRDYLNAMLGESAGTAISPAGERHYVTPREVPFEYMLNALRLNAGFDAAEFRDRTGVALATVQPALESAVGRGLLEQTTTGWRATAMGRRFLNDLQAGFLE